MEPEGLRPHSHEPATCPYSEPHQYSPNPTIPLLGDQFQYYPPICAWVLQVVFFPQVSPPKHCMHHSSSPYKLHAPAHLILLDLIIQIIFGEEFRSFSSYLCSLFHSPVISSLWGQNILLGSLLSNSLSLCSSLNVSDLVSLPYKTEGKIWVLYILHFIFLGSKCEDKIFCTEWEQAFPGLNLLLISSQMEFWCSQIFDLFYPFKGSIINLYIVILYCILILRHDCVLRFLIIYF